MDEIPSLGLTGAIVTSGKGRSARVAERPRKRTYNIRLIKRSLSYTFQEIADLFGIHENTVLAWVHQGLRADKSERPFLIRGSELARFLTARQAHKRRRCTSDEFYCFRCRVPRRAYLGIVDIVVKSPARLNLKALCSVCDTPMNKVQNVGEMAAIQERFSVQELTGTHLLERADPSLNCALEP